MSVRFLLNGERVHVGDVDPHKTLLGWLRERGLTGSKEGCAEGECGACAVAFLRRGPDGTPRYDAVNSCLVPLPSLDGQNVWTVEGVAEPDGTLHPVQAALVESGGSQCGYCTPGFVVSLFCEYYRPDRVEPDPESISGNLCRCTGYRPILEVLKAMPAAAPEDPRRPERRLSVVESETEARLEHVAGARRFLRPETLAQVFEALERFPDATLIAGGTDLMVYVNQRAARYPVLISLEAVAELRRCEAAPRELVLGAGLPLSELEGELAARCPGELGLLEQLLPLFSSRLIKNRATLGGNLGTASPIGDSPPALLALDAELTLVSKGGVRRVPLLDYFTGYRESVLRTGELIASVHVPRPAPRVQRFYKVSKRMLDDISTVAGAFGLELDAAGRVQRLRIAFGGVAATPVRALAAESAALGRPWQRATVEALLDPVSAVATPITDHRGSVEYRRAMVRRLLQKFFAETALAEAAE
jgi:xanthine dehydrogenase small subunit